MNQQDMTSQAATQQRKSSLAWARPKLSRASGRQHTKIWLQPATLLLGTLALCLAVLSSSFVARRPVWQTQIDVGAEGRFLAEGQMAKVENFYGFQTAEVSLHDQRSFRWTSGRASLVVPGALHIQPLVVRIVACGCRSDQSPAPVSLLLNNSEVLRFTAGQEWQSYQVVAPLSLTHPDYGLMVELRTPEWRSPDGRDLGVAVDRIELRQAAASRLSDVGSTLAVMLGVVGLAWRRRGLVSPLLLVTSWLVVNALYQPQLLPPWLNSSVLLAGWLLLALMHGRSVWAALASSILSVWLVLSPQFLGRWLVDDALISFRYAHNFITGHGLVFNAGERVEGYTNFLWTMLLAAVMVVGVDPVVASAALTLLLAFVIVLLTVVLAKQVMSSGWAWTAAGLLVVNAPFLLYTSWGSGMETALFTALALATVVALARDQWKTAGLLTVLTLLTRPDGILLAAVGGLSALLVGKRCRLWSPFVTYSTIIILLFGPYYVWRWSYYGYPLPNTFYVKVGSSGAQVIRGLGYLWAFGRDYWILGTGLGGALIGLWVWRRTAQRRTMVSVLITAFASLYALYVVMVGGDWMPGARFGVPLAPLLAILTIWGLAGLVKGIPRLLAPVAALLVLLIVALALRLPSESKSNAASRVYRHDYLVKVHREVGRWINLHTPANVTITEDWAGATPYYADRPTIDILGLNDLYIAHLPSSTLGSGLAGHEKTDAGYVLGRRPEIIPWNASPYLSHHPLFEANYQREMFNGPEGRGISLFVRRDVHLVEH